MLPLSFKNAVTYIFSRFKKAFINYLLSEKKNYFPVTDFRKRL